LTEALRICETWCDTYLQAFNARDVARITGHWHFPAMLLIRPAVFIHKNPETFQQNTIRLLDFYQAQGVANAKRRCLKAEFLTETEITLQVHDCFNDHAGKRLAEWSAAYMLKEIDQSWRAILASAEGESQAWAARGTPLPGF